MAALGVRKADGRLIVSNCYDIHAVIRLSLYHRKDQGVNMKAYALMAVEMLGQRYLDKFPSPHRPRITDRHQNHALAKRLIMAAKQPRGFPTEKAVWQFLAETFNQPSYLKNSAAQVECQSAVHPNYTPVRSKQSKHGWLARRIVEMFEIRTGQPIAFNPQLQGKALVDALMYTFDHPNVGYLTQYSKRFQQVWK